MRVQKKRALETEADSQSLLAADRKGRSQFEDSCRILDESSKENCTTLRVCFCILGVGYLFPYNTLITAVDFFQLIYSPEIDFYFAWLLTAPNLLTLTVNLFKPQLAARFGHSSRIVSSLILFLALIVVIPLLRSQWLCFVCTAAMGLVTAVISIALFDLLGFLGADLMSSFQTGLGLGGVIVGVIRIVTKAMFGVNQTEEQLLLSTKIYFVVAFTVILFNVIVYCFLVLPRIGTRLSHIRVVNEAKAKLKNRKSKKRTMDPIYGATTQRTAASPRDDEWSLSLSSETSPTLARGNKEASSPSLTYALLAIWPLVFALVNACLVCLALFPGVISLMTAFWDHSGWFPVFQIFLFNACDTVGKYSTINAPLVHFCFGNALPHWRLIATSMLRYLLVPLFIACVAYPLSLPYYVSIAANIVLGLSQGFVVTACMNLAAANVDVSLRGFVMQIMVWVLTLGLTLGSCLSFPLLLLINAL